MKDIFSYLKPIWIIVLLAPDAFLLITSAQERSKELKLSHPDSRKQDLTKEQLPYAHGKYFFIENIKVYETCYEKNQLSSTVLLPKSVSATVLILIYDIFGFHPHFEYSADRIAEKVGVCVVIPDFFHGNPFPRNKYPPRNQQSLTNFIKRNGSFVNVVQPDLKQIVSYYKATRQISQFGTFGYCWGGRTSALVVSDPKFINDFKVAGAVHPSPLYTTEAKNVGRPVLLLPSRDEPNLIPFCRLVNRKLGPGTCRHKRFNDMSHGFSGGLSDWTNKRVKIRVEESIEILSNFLKENLK